MTGGTAGLEDDAGAEGSFAGIEWVLGRLATGEVGSDGGRCDDEVSWSFVAGGGVGGIELVVSLGIQFM